jgi:peroxin-12
MNHHEEFFAFLLLLVERHHLKKHSELPGTHHHTLKYAGVDT